MDSDDEFEDANDDVMDDEDIFGTGAGGASGSDHRGPRLQPLIPDDYGDEAMAGIKFSGMRCIKMGLPGKLIFGKRKGCQFNWLKIRLENRLKNPLRLKLDSVTCLNYKFFLDFPVQGDPSDGKPGLG